MGKIVSNNKLDIESKMYLVKETTHRIEFEASRKEQLIKNRTGADLLEITEDINGKLIDAIKAKISLLNEVY